MPQTEQLSDLFSYIQLFMKILKIRTGFGTFWKVIENAIFQDLESFGKEKFLRGYGKVLDFCFGKF